MRKLRELRKTTEDKHSKWYKLIPQIGSKMQDFFFMLKSRDSDLSTFLAVVE